MVSIRMIVKSGQKNELQNLGFRTYYNHCGVMETLVLGRVLWELPPIFSFVQFRGPHIVIFQKN